MLYIRSRGWPAGLQALLEHSYAHSLLLLLSCYSFVSSFLDLSPSPNHLQHQPPPFHLSWPRQRKVIFSNIPVFLIYIEVIFSKLKKIYISRTLSSEHYLKKISKNLIKPNLNKLLFRKVFLFSVFIFW